MGAVARKDCSVNLADSSDDHLIIKHQKFKIAQLTYSHNFILAEVETVSEEITKSITV